MQLMHFQQLRILYDQDLQRIFQIPIDLQHLLIFLKTLKPQDNIVLKLNLLYFILLLDEYGATTEQLKQGTV